MGDALLPQEALSRLLRYPLLLRQLLLARGITTDEEAEIFLNPDYERDLHDPFLMKDMEKAMVRIGTAIKKEERIMIFGDYDVDGIVATAILWRTIYQDLGYHNCRPFIPNRFEHGYGLSRPSIDSIISMDIGERILLITVDCGITAKEKLTMPKVKALMF